MAGVWNIAVAISGPIFSCGLNHEQYRVEVAVWEAGGAVYEQAVLQAFAEASNLLTSQQNLIEEPAQRERGVKALK
ncbi:MAG: hypothetical protein P8R42_06515 [Candidatus Binatia bacterium]|nr:hypothetical protein [Candidatus Binatia bacterium]